MKIILVLLTLFLCIAVDQTSKELAGHYLSSIQSSFYLQGLVGFKYVENTGMFSSLGAGLTATTRFWLFTVVVSIALFSLLAYILLNKTKSKLFLVGGAMIVGGGTSNVIDRIVNDGAVIDFIFLSIFGNRTEIFNIADVLITLGMIGLLIAYRKRIRQ